MGASEGTSNMTTIKVDPPLLQSSGKDIQGNAQTISSAGSSVLDAAESAPSYNGQFGPLVAPIGQEAYAKLGSSANQLNDIGARLSFKGTEFQAVDNETTAEFTILPPLNNISETAINPASTIDSNTSEQIMRYLNLGGNIVDNASDSNNLLSAVLPMTTMLGNLSDGELNVIGDIANVSDDADAILGPIGNILTVGQDVLEYRNQGVAGVASAVLVDASLTVGEEVGGEIAGEAAGTVAGAVVGGIIGSIIPGAGTIAGAEIGSWIGGDIGGAVGPIAARWVVENSGIRTSVIATLTSDVNSGFSVFSN